MCLDAKSFAFVGKRDSYCFALRYIDAFFFFESFAKWLDYAFEAHGQANVKVFSFHAFSPVRIS